MHRWSEWVMVALAAPGQVQALLGDILRRICAKRLLVELLHVDGLETAKMAIASVTGLATALLLARAPRAWRHVSLAWLHHIHQMLLFKANQVDDVSIHLLQVVATSPVSGDNVAPLVAQLTTRISVSMSSHTTWRCTSPVTEATAGGASNNAHG